MKVVESTEVATHCENVLGELQVNVPGMQVLGSGVEDGVVTGVVAAVDEGGDVEMRVVRVVPVVAGRVGNDGEVVEVSVMAVSVVVGVVVAVLMVKMLVALPVSVSMGLLVCEDPVPVPVAVVTVEFSRGKGGVDVGIAVELEVPIPVVAVVAVIAAVPSITKPGPG